MSTKTTFKRIALVAVASLGFGVLTSVAPACAALAGTATPTAATITNSSTTLAGRVGQQVTVPITATTLAVGSVAAKYATLRFVAAITTQLATSVVYAGLASGSTALGIGFTLVQRGINISAGSAAALTGDFAARTSNHERLHPGSG